MKIVFNPQKPKGSDIHGFVSNGQLVEEHLAGKLVQYEDQLAVALVENFGFLQIVDSQQVEKILATPKVGEFKCEFCDFSTDTKLALAGHRRSHKDEIEAAQKIAIDPEKVPVAQVKKLKKVVKVEEEDQTADGIDKDGVEWYGGGASETKQSFQRVPKVGKGHFKGGSL